MKHTYKFALSLTVVGGLTFVASEHIHDAYAAEIQANPTQTDNHSKADGPKTETTLSSDQSQVSDASNHTGAITSNSFNKVTQSSDSTHNNNAHSKEENVNTQPESAPQTQSTAHSQQDSQGVGESAQTSPNPQEDAQQSNNQLHSAQPSQGNTSEEHNSGDTQQHDAAQDHSQQVTSSNDTDAAESQQGTSLNDTDVAESQQERQTSSQPILRATSNAETPETTSAPMENTKTMTIKNVVRGNNTAQAGTLRGQNHMRQSLDIVVPANTKAYIRSKDVVNKKQLTAELITDSSKSDARTNFALDNQWHEIQASKDGALFIKTPSNLDGPVDVEYYVEGNKGVDMPHYKLNGDIEKFKRDWQETDAAFAVAESEHSQILIPHVDKDYVLDMENTSNPIGFKSLDETLNYHEDMLKHYDHWLGLDDSSDIDANSPQQYFIRADKTGAGAAYYNPDHTATNGDSVVPFLSRSWLLLHEVGHGYDGYVVHPNTATDIVLLETWNNIYGNLMVSTVDPKQGDWLYGGKQEAYQKQELDKMTKNDDDYQFIRQSFKSRLNIMATLVRGTGEESFIKFNKYMRQMGNKVKERSINDQLAEEWGNLSDVNLIPYFDLAGIPVNESVKERIYEQGNTILYPLSLLTSDEAEQDRIKESEHMVSRHDLVSTDALKDVGITTSSTIDLKLNGNQLRDNAEVRLLDDKRVVATAQVKDNQVHFEDVPMGVYKVEAPFTTDGKLPKTEYIVMKAHEDNQLELNYPADAKANYSEVANFLGLSNDNVASLTYNPTTNKVKITDSLKAPHVYFKTNYITMTIKDKNGEVKYHKEMVGNQAHTGDNIEDVDVQPGDTLEIYHAEPGRLKFSNNNTNQPISALETKNQTTTYHFTPYGLTKTDEDEAYQRYIDNLKAELDNKQADLEAHPDLDSRKIVSGLYAEINNLKDQDKQQFIDDYRELLEKTGVIESEDANDDNHEEEPTEPGNEDNNNGDGQDTGSNEEPTEPVDNDNNSGDSEPGNEDDNAENPVDPGDDEHPTQPGDSEEQPSEPGDDDSNSGDAEQPTEPGDNVEQPGDNGSEPGNEEQPSEPGNDHNQPGDTEQPGDNDNEPGHDEQTGNDDNHPGEGEHEDPNEPGDNEQPSNPGNEAPTEPGENETDPGSSEEPSVPGDETDPTVPGDEDNNHSKDDDTGSSEEPTEPGDSDEQPGDPEQPTEPSNEDDNSENPVDPGDDDQPSQPGDSEEQPSEPGNDQTQPGDTTQPSENDNNHDDSDEPNQPGNEEQPGDNSSETSDNEQPTQPGVNDNNPSDSEQPDEPGKDSKDDSQANNNTTQPSEPTSPYPGSVTITEPSDDSSHDDTQPGKVTIQEPQPEQQQDGKAPITIVTPTEQEQTSSVEQSSTTPIEVDTQTTQDTDQLNAGTCGTALVDQNSVLRDGLTSSSLYQPNIIQSAQASQSVNTDINSTLMSEHHLKSNSELIQHPEYKAIQPIAAPTIQNTEDSKDSTAPQTQLPDTGKASQNGSLWGTIALIAGIFTLRWRKRKSTDQK
ncbi:putative mucin/carbohydrate-binding domain-containing protein [Staphylococcus pettenkoferi]|uniref:putative mucin/carbohydrate-binding domain-containing protein n=1 Tax=Staphylococcus pettenkoferi TaxID=170573 RepID=UPI0022770259|nr:putative mucin/carbohydrate-binding domain-containing protein [Staphylococcus pettenkoferi]MCY1591615.1 LPXTG cell wall anchor domain-containing protein [Staphylococcus pettenkoferi]MCY1610014.1 LPXTG cell wall anchor domain-containing protein [Staphylococcus pettenkoferi]MCY1624454.1 LPXTG cell wall anchor domain-containing protein [Staphylococcus pettenkoferi]